MLYNCGLRRPPHGPNMAVLYNCCLRIPPHGPNNAMEAKGRDWDPVKLTAPIVIYFLMFFFLIFM